jgi:ABC-type Fe3+-siderophore transport system permease subunit
VLPAGRVDASETTPVPRIPVWSMLLLAGAALAVSVADVPRNHVVAAGVLGTSGLLVAVFAVLAAVAVPASSRATRGQSCATLPCTR